MPASDITTPTIYDRMAAALVAFVGQVDPACKAYARKYVIVDPEDFAEVFLEEPETPEQEIEDRIVNAAFVTRTNVTGNVEGSEVSSDHGMRLEWWYQADRKEGQSDVQVQRRVDLLRRVVNVHFQGDTASDPDDAVGTLGITVSSPLNVDRIDDPMDFVGERLCHVISATVRMWEPEDSTNAVP